MVLLLGLVAGYIRSRLWIATCHRCRRSCSAQFSRRPIPSWPLRSPAGSWPSAASLKHTAITLAIQAGISVEDAADYFSTSLETIQKVYWHHSPHHQARAVAAMNSAAQIRTETTAHAQK